MLSPHHCSGDTTVEGGTAVTDAGDINELDATTVERIAAGEVVERPASAVKELIENSLDADASRITIEAESGGVDRIRVVDDGVGMTEQAVRKAVRQHTTSKIEHADDLDAGVTTLGFRGEALHTIGAVSRMTITTKPRGGETGTKLRYEGGEVVSVDPAGTPEGTAVEIRDLFFNTPARRKYLGRQSTEFAHVNRVATRYALANPDVAISLEHDGRETFSTTGRGDLQEAILAVYGREVATSMCELSGEPSEGPLSAVRGFISDPETTRSAREVVSTYVNGRYVSDSTLRGAVLDAYGDQLAADRYPFAVLFLDVPPSEVDVNVHPRKMEVRFGNADGIYGQLKDVVRETLLAEGLTRTSAPRGRSAPEQTEITPERSRDEADDGDEGEDLDADVTWDRKADADPDAEADASPASRRSGGNAQCASETTADDASPTANESFRRPRSPASARTARSQETESSAAIEPDSPSDESGDSSSSVSRGDSPSRSGEPSTASDDASRISGPTEQRTLSGEALDSPEFDRLPQMRVMGQFDDTYLVGETDDGLVLIDQHAADERIHYERLRAAFANETTSQMLAEPTTIELTAGEAAAFDAHEDALARLGFRGSQVDDRRVAVRAVPSVFDETLDPDLLCDALSSFVAAADDPGDGPVDIVADDLLADMACHPALTGNTSLTEGSIEALLSALDDCENPYACPHGRPVIVEIDHSEIADRFERDYPGHDGRRRT